MVDILAKSFYQQDTLTVARSLLGSRLVRILAGERLSGLIVETEGYNGEEDLGCHAHSGRTRRNAVMFGPAGRAYVYFTYGMHWCLNTVTREENFPAAVLLRAIYPLEGLDTITANRHNRPAKQLCDGPAKLTQALAIDGSLNGSDLCDPANGLFIERGIDIPQQFVNMTARIGLENVPEPWRSKPWRFLVKDISPLVAAGLR